MDFLRIRDKAKARSADPGRPAEPSVAAAPPPPAAPPASEADAVEGALAALQGLPPAKDARFATWRPGSGAPPDVLPVPEAVEAFGPDDFALVRPPEGAAAREPFLPSAGSTLDPRVAVAPQPAAAARPAPLADPLDEFLYRDDEDAPAVPGFEAAVAGVPASSGATDVREEYITFLLGAEEYAVAIERVREVLRCPPVTEVPRAPAHVRGVVSVRGEVVAVIDPRRRLGLPGSGDAPATSRLLVVEVGDGPVGLLVDAVSSVVRLRPGSIEPCPQGIGGSSQEFLAGIGREGERLFTVLDLGALLRRAPAGRRRAERAPRAG